MSNLLSHDSTPKNLDTLLQEKIEGFRRQGDKPYVTVEQQIALAQQLSQFEFGRFLLQNRGVNGYWTHYMLTHPWRKTVLENELEKFILEKSPVLLATQERLKIFLAENQKSVAPGKQLACVPCGLMGELLYLDYEGIKNIELTGIDYDEESLKEAEKFAQAQGLLSFSRFKKADAWQLPFKNSFDLISSNGLNIYEPQNEKVVALYQQFYEALKPGGKLVTSFLTPPPTLTDNCEWDFSKLNQDDLLLQKILFIDILDARFQCFRSSVETQEQLRQVGFQDISFIYDQAHIFPTVIALKPQ